MIIYMRVLNTPPFLRGLKLIAVLRRCLQRPEYPRLIELRIHALAVIAVVSIVEALVQRARHMKHHLGRILLLYLLNLLVLSVSFLVLLPDPVVECNRLQGPRCYQRGNAVLLDVVHDVQTGSQMTRLVIVTVMALHEAIK